MYGRRGGRRGGPGQMQKVLVTGPMAPYLGDRYVNVPLHGGKSNHKRRLHGRQRSEKAAQDPWGHKGMHR